MGSPLPKMLFQANQSLSPRAHAFMTSSILFFKKEINALCDNLGTRQGMYEWGLGRRLTGQE